jgi:hypothetical protein
MPVVKKILTTISLVFLPGLLVVFFFFAFSFIGVFIEEDKYLLLVGGFQQFIIMLVLFIFANFLAWFIVEFVFKYSKLLTSGFKTLLLFLSSWLIQIICFGLYYYILFYVISGLRLNNINFIISEKFSNDLRILAFGLFVILTLINITAHIIFLTLRHAEVGKSENNNVSEKKSEGKFQGEAKENSSSFEDSISI